MKKYPSFSSLNMLYVIVIISGYDLTSTAVLSYSGGRRAILNYTMNKCYDEMATMMGTKGIMKVGIYRTYYGK